MVGEVHPLTQAMLTQLWEVSIESVCLQLDLQVHARKALYGYINATVINGGNQNKIQAVIVFHYKGTYNLGFPTAELTACPHWPFSSGQLDRQLTAVRSSVVGR